jgi:hypothetical protein
MRTSAALFGAPPPSSRSLRIRRVALLAAPQGPGPAHSHPLHHPARPQACYLLCTAIRILRPSTPHGNTAPCPMELRPWPTSVDSLQRRPGQTQAHPEPPGRRMPPPLPPDRLPVFFNDREAIEADAPPKSPKKKTSPSLRACSCKTTPLDWGRQRRWCAAPRPPHPLSA